MAEPDDSSEPLPTQPWSGPPGTPTPGGGAPTPGAPRGGWQPPEPEQIQASFPQYEIRGVLGRGGMGAVYQGWQKSLDRLVAIKILPPGLEDNGANFAERFQREAKAMARFSHPGIVAVYDAGETPDGLFYFVMEYIEGTDVQKMVRENGPLPPEHALAITAHVCDALAYAHKRGVIHRDIKPANIMVDAEGQVKVADFGLAKVTNDDSAELVTGTNVSMGTMDFMAPEALYGMAQVDHRADLYAVGVMLYQMLTGEVPRGLFDMPSKHREGIDPRFDEIVKHAMQKDPAKRYASATDIRTDLDKILSSPVPHRSAAEPIQSLSAPPRPAAKVESDYALPGPLGQRQVSDAEAWGSWLPASGSAKPPTEQAHPPEPAASEAGGPSRRSKRRVWLTSGIVATLLVFMGGVAFFHDRSATPVATSAPSDHKIERIRESIPPLEIASAASSTSPIGTFAGHRYQFVSGAWRWDEAKARAESMGGHLATITSQEENTWVQTTFGALFDGRQRSASLWLGGTAEASDQPWRWVTGEPFDFTDWNKGEPNFDSTAGHQLKGPFAIALKNHGQLYWFSDPIDRKNVSLGFLVEWDDAGRTPATPEPAEATIPEAQPVPGKPGFVRSPHAPDKGYIDVRGMRPGTKVKDPYSGQMFLVPATAAPAGGAAVPAAPPLQTPATATKDAPFVNTLGMKFVPVPITGGPTGGQRVLFSVWETRVQDYEVFVKETKRQWLKPDFEQGPTHPAVNVSWNLAQAFCTWLTDRERLAGRLGTNERYRLPSDHEWSCAVGIGDRENATAVPAEKNVKIINLYPWGTTWPAPPGTGNFAGEEWVGQAPGNEQKGLSGFRDDFLRTAPVGKFPANFLGIFDLGGNVAEWCEDLFGRGEASRVFRGSSYAITDPKGYLSSFRYYRPPELSGSSFGFRVVLAPVP